MRHHFAFELRKSFFAVSTLLLLNPPAFAQTTPISGIDNSVNQGASSILSGYDRLSSGFTAVDSTIAMLSHIIKIAAGMPIVGPLAQMLTPVLNSYLDYKATLQPLFESMQRGRDNVAKFVGIKDSIKNLFSSTNFNDSVNNINALVNQFGGLANLPQNLRSVSSTNARADVANILKAADYQIKETAAAAEKAKASGNVFQYRHYLALTDQLQHLRGRIQMAGETAAAQQDNATVVSRTTSTAEQVANDAVGHATNLQTVQSAEGGIKVLGAIALEQSNTMAQGFQALSQQLTTISKLQTVTNEQNDQLLQHYQAEERERTAKLRAAVEAQQTMREQQYQTMQKKATSLGDAIAQTLKPNATRQSDMNVLMKGQLP